MKLSDKIGLAPQLREALIGNSAGILFGAGTSSKRATTTKANSHFLSFYVENEATSGDGRGIYLRQYISGAGGGGEAARFFSTVNGVAAGTVHGAHISLNFAKPGLVTGEVTGQGIAMRATLHIPENATTIGGSLFAGQSEIYADGSGSSTTDISTVPHAIHRFIVDGDATARAKVYNVFSFENLGSTALANAGTGANSAGNPGGGVAAKVIRVLVDGTAYYMPLFSSNAS